METDYTKLLKILNENDLTSFKEISDLLGWSRYTIKKYIADINEAFEKLDFDVKIVQYPREGISLDGSKTEIKKAINSMESMGSAIKDRQIIQTLSILIESNGYITIQELADKLFISKSTCENVLKDVRNLLEKYNIDVIGTRYGIKINTSEKNKRRLIAEIIYSYKNKLVAYSNPKNELKLSLKMSDNVKQFIDFDKIDKVADVLMEFIKISKLYLTEYEFNSLAIHISISIERLNNGLSEDYEIKNVTYEENTLVLVEMLEDAFDINFPSYEKDYINIHILSIQSNAFNKDNFTANNEDNTTIEIKQLKSDIRAILSGNNPDEELINDLSIHLKGAINRLKSSVSIRNQYLDQIKTQFTQAFEFSKELVISLENKFNITFDEDEIGYIAIHIQSFFERKTKSERVDVTLVCGSGYGTAKLLEQRLINVFGEKINIVNRTGIGDIDLVSKDDLIITTVPIETEFNNSIYVSPLLTEHDIKTIRTLISPSYASDSSFLNLISEDFFTIESGKTTQTEVIKNMVDELASKQYVNSNVYEHIMERELLSSTAIRDFAMPHAKVARKDRALIYVYINKNGVIWGSEKVKIVFLFLLNENVKDDLDDIYKFFYEITSSELILQRLINVNDFKEFVEILNNEDK